MSSRQSLLNEIKDLRQVTVKEWFKQAFFRKEKQIEFSLITEELSSIQSLIQGQLSSQEEFISLNLEEIEEAEEYTPRFVSAHQTRGQESSSSFASTLKGLSSIKSLLHQLFENERVIFSRLPNFPEPGFDGNLSEKLEKEREKLNKLTKKYNDLSLEFLKLNETLEDLRFQREQGCDNCLVLKERVDELEEVVQHPNSEIQRVKQMYEELKQAHDQIADELSLNQEQEDDEGREELLKQMQISQETQKKLENYNLDLVKKLKIESEEVRKLNLFVEEYEDEVLKKNAALEKAQGIIKKLNIECEKLAKDLERTEIENESLKKENRQLNKTKTGVDKKRSDIEIMKKTEERLREEISSLKNKLTSSIDQYEIQINHLNGLLTQQSQEKNNLEITLEELEQKLNEIDLINRRRLEEFSSSCSKIQELEDILKKKDQNIEKMAADIERIVNNKDQEFQHLKRQAENMIRHLNTSQNTAKPGKSDKKINEINQTNLEDQLQDSLLREEKLKNLLNDLVNKEGKMLKDLFSNFNKNTANSRAEAERWIMRNEELEQRLLESTDKNLKMLGIIKDLQKMINFKNMQFEEFRKTSENNMKELLSKNDFLQLELNNAYNLISRELLPHSSVVINQALSDSHEKMHSLRQELAKMQERMMSDKEENAKMQSFIRILEDEKESISKLLYRANASLVFIEKVVGEPSHYLQPNPSIVHPSNIAEIDAPGDITEKARITAEKIYQIKENLHLCSENLNKTELDLLNKTKAFEDQSEIYVLLEKSFEKLQEENRYLTEIAYKEKEEKIKLKSFLNEVTETEEKVNRMTDFINQITSEKENIEENYFFVKNELEKAQALMIAQCKKAEDNEEACFLLRSELEKTQAMLDARFKKFEGNEESCLWLRSELEKTQNMLDVKSRKFEEVRENNLREINCLRSKLESVMMETSQCAVDESVEDIRKKKEKDRRSFQKRVKEFELVLRYIEDKINLFLNRTYDPRVERMQSFIEELKKKNPNLTSWLKMLVSNLEKLSKQSSF
jgi:chromosome segregation ATPase